MTTPEGVDNVPPAAGVEPSQAATTAVMEAVLDRMAKGVNVEQSFHGPGFATFASRPRAARKGTHPQMGEPITIQASTAVGFRLAPAFKDKMATPVRRKPRRPPRPGVSGALIRGASGSGALAMA